jgi:hypothetical protein
MGPYDDKLDDQARSPSRWQEGYETPEALREWAGQRGTVAKGWAASYHLRLAIRRMRLYRSLSAVYGPGRTNRQRIPAHDGGVVSASPPELVSADEQVEVTTTVTQTGSDGTLKRAVTDLQRTWGLPGVLRAVVRAVDVSSATIK